MAKATRDVQTLAGVFRAMGEPNRLRLLQALSDGERNVTELCRKLRLPQPTVSRHLGILRGTGLVNNRRQGKQVYYSINDSQGKRTAGALRNVLKDSATLKIGPLVVGLSKRGGRSSK
jgi:ArsR family transcriptional regulator